MRKTKFGEFSPSVTADKEFQEKKVLIYLSKDK
jgi:hypothetical protein